MIRCSPDSRVTIRSFSNNLQFLHNFVCAGLSDIFGVLTRITDIVRKNEIRSSFMKTKFNILTTITENLEYFKNTCSLTNTNHNKDISEITNVNYNIVASLGFNLLRKLYFKMCPGISSPRLRVWE